jgi:hypothetical protein
MIPLNHLLDGGVVNKLRAKRSSEKGQEGADPALVVGLLENLISRIPTRGAMTLWNPTEARFPRHLHLGAVGEKSGVEKIEVLDQRSGELLAGLVQDMRPARKAHTRWKEGKKLASSSQVSVAIVAHHGENVHIFERATRETNSVQDLERALKTVWKTEEGIRVP